VKKSSRAASAAASDRAVRERGASILVITRAVSEPAADAAVKISGFRRPHAYAWGYPESAADAAVKIQKRPLTWPSCVLRILSNN
jgi:hypothetical protein